MDGVCRLVVFSFLFFFCFSLLFVGKMSEPSLSEYQVFYVGRCNLILVSFLLWHLFLVSSLAVGFLVNVIVLYAAGTNAA